MPDADKTIEDRTVTERAGNTRAVHHPIPHDSGRKHVTGEARYTDDIPEPARTLKAYLRLSEVAHGRIDRLDIAPVAEHPGVAAVLTAADVPGTNDVGPVFDGDPIFADGIIHYAGQSLFAVAAEDYETAWQAAHKADIAVTPLDPILTIEQALEADSMVLPTRTIARGDPDSSLAAAPHRLAGTLRVGGQDHFYLEGQVALAIPGEDGDMLVLSSTQHPSEVQHLVARALALPDNAVTVEVRRMGGGFGGKETQAALAAAAASLLARRTGRPVKLCMDRDDDMLNTGKRHDFRIDYDVGFDGDGRIQAITFDHAARCGISPDLSGAIADRAMFHADNCYYLDSVRIRSHRCRTNTVSNTAFRGFGGPQGMIGIETVIDEIARSLGTDPLDVRKANVYSARPGSPEGRDRTPYKMRVEDADILHRIIPHLEQSSEYRARRVEIEAFNRESPVLKRGLALTPVKFGISFTTTHLNQAGALIHVYTDGSVHLNHGGTEMGQGLFIKVAQVVAEVFGIGLDRVKVTATNTGKVPNTSATAASSGSDLNGMAARNAALAIRNRLVTHAAETRNVSPEQIVFRNDEVRIGEHLMAFADLVREAYGARISLSATGYYRTPKIHYDPEKGEGRPFLYFAYGAAVAEAIVDTLTGEYAIPRVDILHDAGQSLNPAIDRGQIEGGFIQGMGWLTTEELWWDGEGRLKTHAPSTYKIPVASDMPTDFRVAMLENAANHEDTVFRSKAVGEPPLMLANAVFFAIKDAIASVATDAGGPPLSPRLDAPATPERVLASVDDIKARVRQHKGAPDQSVPAPDSGP